MRFDARELTIKLLPQEGPHGWVDCKQTCTSVTAGNCKCVGDSKQCDSGSCGDTVDTDKRKSRAAWQASLGRLRQQLRQHLSQPGAF